MLQALTPAEWEAFTPKAKWDCIVALRGPDCRQSDVVKWFTSAIIRGKLRDVMRVGGNVNSTLGVIIAPSFEPQTALSYVKASRVKPGGRVQDSFSWQHFMGHVAEAAQWLRIPTYLVPDATYTDAIGRGEFGAMMFLYPYLNSPAQAEFKESFLAQWGKDIEESIKARAAREAGVVLGGALSFDYETS